MDNDKEARKRNRKAYAKLSMHKQCIVNNSIENSASTTPKASNMKHGWHQIINNIANYYRTPCNVAMIVE